MKTFRRVGLVLGVVLTLAGTAWGQAFNGQISGIITDETGAVVPDVALTLRNLSTDQIVGTTVSGPDGAYAFRNLAPGKYEVVALKEGFQQVTNSDIDVTLSSVQRVEIMLPVGAQEQRVEVVGSSVLNYNSGTQEHGINPDTLQELPLLFGSGPRSAASFATLMPGVATGGRANAFDARINGGLQSGDEATVDGVSMQQGFMNQGGMVSIFQDFPMSPDMVSEVKVLTSNYAPEYGNSTSGQIMAVTKSGGASFHGAGFEYHRNDALNATQWGSDRKAPLNRNNYGFNIGGPAKVPGLWNDKWKSYFYFNYEGYRQTGGSNLPTLSIPSIAARNGDFRNWRDSAGNVIPIYDPATLRPDGQGGFIKDQFMGCDGNTPNVICPDRINPIVLPWLNALPNPTSGGELNNYQPPSSIPDSILGDSDYYMGRFDLQVGASDHMFLSVWHQRAPAKFLSILPQPIATETYSDPQNSWVSRFNYDKIFSSTLLNHLGMGYLNRNEGYGCVNQDFVSDFPQIAGVADNNVPPQIGLADYNSMGCNAGVNVGNITTRPTFIINDIVTWTKGAHTLKVGMEYRSIMGNIHQNGNQAGSFFFGRGSTGIVGVNSGSGVASFLLGAVDSGNVNFYDTPNAYPRQSAWVFHAGDTWRIGNKLTLDYGLRWDYFSPSREKFNRFSFFDPFGANPGAGGLPGRLAFAGDEWGAASYGAEYPEEDWYGGFAPRLGAVYSLNDKTVVRAGWGIFYTQAFYPGWGGGISQDGFSTNVAFNTTLGGIRPAFYLDEGFPQNFQPPPFIASDYRNGQGILYRPIDANERPYSHQWNLTVDRELGYNLGLSVAYVGSAGRRLPSSISPLNAIDPTHLSMGNQLYDEFEPGMASLHGVPLPYDGWVEQMTGCAPSVAQALRPYPQYCSSLQGLNENYGESHYNSLQMKLEKRFSQGTYALVSYTLSKTISSGSDNVQRDALTWDGVQGVISPYEQSRNEAIAVDDTPHILSAAFVYQLPFGDGQKYMNSGGVSNAVLGGWQVSAIYRYSSGLPFYFRSSFCNIPGQIRAACIPAVTNAGAVFAQDLGDFDPANGPLFNRDAFEPVDSFNFYYGRGNRIEEDIRGQSYKNVDLSFIKNTRLPGNTNLQIRLEMFNLFNWHIFNASGEWGSSAFNTDIASSDFGIWNGNVSEPRNIQLGVRFEF